MHIKFAGVERAPSWESLEKLICDMLATEGRLTKIERLDGRCDYRAPGDYELTFRPEGEADIVEIGLSVNP